MKCSGAKWNREISYACSYQSLARSTNPGFTLSINLFFFILLHFFNCFSLAIALCISLHSSQYSNNLQLYLAVNQSINHFLCSYALRYRLFVTQIYNELLLIFHMIYTEYLFISMVYVNRYLHSVFRCATDFGRYDRLGARKHLSGFFKFFELFCRFFGDLEIAVHDRFDRIYGRLKTLPLLHIA